MAIPAALATIKDDRGISPIHIIEFLLSLVRLNDNTGNDFSDHAYMASLVDSLGLALLPAQPIQLALQSMPSEEVLEHKRVLNLALEEIERWILSWGEHAKVLGPKLLADSVKQRIQRNLKQYR
jgi:transcription initiation factor TFIID subunit 2